MFMQQLSVAFNSYTKAFKLLSAKNLWGLVLLSGLVYLLLIIGGGLGLYYGVDAFIDWVMHIGWIEKANNWAAVKWLIKIMMFGVYISSFFAYFSIFKFVLLTVASPLYAYISERADSAITGNDYPFNAVQLLKDIIRGVRISLKNLVKQSFFTILLWLCSFIPIIGLLSTVLIIALDIYYYGFAMLDYNSERKRMSMADSFKFISQRKGLAIGNGLVFYVLFLIPIIGIVIGAPLSAIAATISLYDDAGNNQ
jgi:CysZ protein